MHIVIYLWYPMSPFILVSMLFLISDNLQSFNPIILSPAWFTMLLNPCTKIFSTVMYQLLLWCCYKISWLRTILKRVILTYSSRRISAYHGRESQQQVADMVMGWSRKLIVTSPTANTKKTEQTLSGWGHKLLMMYLP